MTPGNESADERAQELELTPGRDGEVAPAEAPNLKDPAVVLSLLEADQVVAAKRQSRFGRRDLSLEVRILLWALRIYVVVMLLLVAVSVFRAIHAPY